MSKSTKKETRATFNERIRAASTIRDKYWIARDLFRPTGEYFDCLLSIDQLVNFLLGHRRRIPMARPESKWDYEMRRHAGYGWLFCQLIAEHDHRFFSRLASILRRPLKSSERPRLSPEQLILQFCWHHKCGTKAAPCDAQALRDFLMRNRCDYSASGLRRDCNKLGIVLGPFVVGRPKKRSK